jgi:hypothetical protein
MPTPPQPPSDTGLWLARLRHDLVKRVVWPARDRRDLGGAPAPGELDPRLVDEEGRPTTVDALWAELAVDAPAGLDLTAFERALSVAQAAAAAGELDGVLGLEAAFDALSAQAQALARSLEGKP